MDPLLIAAGALAALVLALLVVGFNRLRRADVAAQEALAGLDVQLTRRAELVPNLVAVVRGHAAHERGVLAEVTQARTQVQRAAAGDDVAARAAADAELERSLVHLDAVAEAYPELRADTTFGQLQRQLADTEDQVSFARQYYNDAVRRLNDLTRTIPWMYLTGWAGVSGRDFYEAPDEHRDPPQVRF